jgi:hypothetical protein
VRPSSTLLLVGVVILVVVVHARPAAAEQADVVSVLVDGPIKTNVPASTLDAMEDAFRGGDLATARVHAATVIDAAKAATSNTDPYDYSRNVLAVVWPGVDGSGKTALRRLMLPAPSSQPFAIDLPGIEPGADPPRLYELLITADGRSRLVSQYTFTRVDNPILAQIPEVISRLVGPLFSIIGAGTVDPSLRALRSTEVLYVVASRVAVPFGRATVKTKSYAQVPVRIEEWAQQVQTLGRSLRFNTVVRSEWAKAYVEKLAGNAATEGVAVKTAKEKECTDPAYDATACLKKFDVALQDAYTECLTKCLTSGTPSTDDVKAIQVVDAKFRELISAGPQRLESAAEFRNRPLTHFAFGLGTAVMARPSLNKTRVKLNDAGNLVADPLRRQLSIVLLHWSPSGYDDDAPRIQRAERFRLFAAGIITPDFGVGAGASFLLVRGVGITGGGGLLVTRALGPNDGLGKPPGEPSKPFAVGVAKTAFVGICLNFK